MESQKRILGILNLVYGLIHLIFLLGVHVFLSSFLPFILGEAQIDGAMALEMAFSLARVIMLVLIVLIPMPSIIAGIGLLSKKSWGLIMALIAGCISLLNFPFGTALGAYSIYVYVEDQKNRDD